MTGQRSAGGQGHGGQGHGGQGHGGQGAGAQGAGAAHCDSESDVCITCSDSAVAVTIVRLLGDGLAIADTGSGQEEVSVALVSAGVGDTVLVHAREAIAVVSR